MTGRLGATLCGLFFLAMNGPLGAQRSNWMEAGVSAVRFTDDGTDAIGPSFRGLISGVSGRRFYSADAGGIVTPGSAAGSVSLGGGARTALADGWLGELSTGMSAVGGSGTAGGTGTAELHARALRLWGSGGAWVRANALASKRLHSTIGGGGADAGAWWSHEGSTIAASVQHEWTRAELYLFSLHRGFSGSTAVRYTDASLIAHLEGTSTEVDGAISARRDADAARLWMPGGSLQGVVWLSPRLGLSGGYANQLPDWIHGADASNVFTVGMRVRQAGGPVSGSRRVLVSVDAPGDDGARTLRVQTPDADAVEVMGDFTNWLPRALSRGDNGFVSRVAMPGGPHRIVVRINGGPWQPASNTPSVDDEFGGKAGVFVAP